MIILDHKTPEWVIRQRRTNGAETYSADLVRYQIPLWRAALPDNSIISTCPKFCEVSVSGKFDVAIQYLHTFPERDPVGFASFIEHNLPFKTDRLIFITAYKAYERMLVASGHNAIFVPMAIDIDATRKTASDDAHNINDRMIWFGNVNKEKHETYVKVQNAARRAGYSCDVISRMRFNSTMLPNQAEAWKIVSRYKYAFAVGRCALECFALGLRVLVAGRNIGGIVMSEDDQESQTFTNFNARYATFSNSVDYCLKYLSQSQIVEPLDIRMMNHAAFIG